MHPHWNLAIGREEGLLARSSGRTCRFFEWLELLNEEGGLSDEVLDPGAVLEGAPSIYMADSQAFEWTCEELERSSSLAKLESRGTVRLTLKKAGLEARNVTPDQMRVVVERTLADELRTRGVDDPERVCRDLLAGLANLSSSDAPPDSPEEVFRRLGG